MFWRESLTAVLTWTGDYFENLLFWPDSRRGWIMGVADWLVKNFFNFLRFIKNSSLTSVVLGFVLPRVSAVDLLNRWEPKADLIDFNTTNLSNQLPTLSFLVKIRQVNFKKADYSNWIICECERRISAKVAVLDIICHKARLSPIGRGVNEGPAKFGTGSATYDAIMYVSFVLCKSSSVDV